MSYDSKQVKRIIEAALMAASEPLKMEKLLRLFDPADEVSKDVLHAALRELEQDYVPHSIELKELASGYCLQVKAEFAPWIMRLWEEKPPRYSRATLETLALIVYRQPITRAEIEDIRGVAVSTNLIKALQDRQWIKVVGHKDVPGHPALYATTSAFLDYFNLKDLTQLPPLADLQNLNALEDALAPEQLTILALDVASTTHSDDELERLVAAAETLDKQGLAEQEQDVSTITEDMTE